MENCWPSPTRTRTGESGGRASYSSKKPVTAGVSAYAGRTSPIDASSTIPPHTATTGCPTRTIRSIAGPVRVLYIALAAALVGAPVGVAVAADDACLAAPDGAQCP